MTFLKPTALKKGSTIALITPSSRPYDPGKITSFKQFLEQQGFHVRLGQHLTKRFGNFAGTDAVRVEDFHWAWSDPEIDAIICERGGNGGARILPYLDFDMIRKNPKIFVGYSDITAFHLAIHQLTSLVTFHGPVGTTARSSRYTWEQLFQALTSTHPIGAIGDPPEPEGGAFPPPYPPYRMVFNEGEAVGELIGGNFTLISQLMGTPYEIDTKGKILFLEDIGEDPSSLDQMLTHLKHAGKLDDAAGIIFGACEQCGPQDYFLMNFSLEEIFREHTAHLNIPVVYGLRLGHTKDQFTIPLGVQAQLTAHTNEVQLSILEAACR